MDEVERVSELQYGNLPEEAKREICAWRYGGAYAIYDLPDYEEIKARQTGFMDPKREKNYFGFWHENALVGYVNLQEEEQGISIGIGVKPELCGKHYGRRILLTACALCQKRYPDKPVYLEVRTWNERAIQCYEKAGFQIAGQAYELTTGIGTGTFYRMIRASSQKSRR